MNIIGVFGDDGAETDEIAREAVLWYVRRGFELVSTVAEAASTDDSYKYLKTASRFDPSQITRDYYHFLKENDLVAVGAPSEALRVAARYRETGADQVLFFLQYGAIAHERVMRSIELLGRDVLPEVHSWKTGGCVTPWEGRASA